MMGSMPNKALQRTLVPRGAELSPVRRLKSTHEYQVNQIRPEQDLVCVFLTPVSRRATD